MQNIPPFTIAREAATQKWLDRGCVVNGGIAANIEQHPTMTTSGVP
jgi:hypothetical protein